MMAMCVSLKAQGSGLSYDAFMLAYQSSGRRRDKCQGEPTKSRHEPPPRYSITIHSLLPRRKLALYWVTWELAQVLSTEISAWMS
jgi:hypothetical protein